MVKQAIRPAIFTWRQTEPELILCAGPCGTRSRSAMAKSGSARAAWKRTPRPSGVGSSTTVTSWRSGCAVISSPPRSPGVSLRPTFVSGAVGAPSPAPSIPLALRSTACARGGALPRRPTACSARRCLIRRILGPASSTRTAHAATARRLPACNRKASGNAVAAPDRSQYVHTIVEPDHRAITRRVNATQGFRDVQAVQAARRTIQGDEAMHMIRKGQARWVSGLAVRQQRPCIHHLFEVAA